MESALRVRAYPDDSGGARCACTASRAGLAARGLGLANEIDLAGVEHGAQVFTCSDMFFAHSPFDLRPVTPEVAVEQRAVTVVAGLK